jgi:hypothetical protein
VSDGLVVEQRKVKAPLTGASHSSSAVDLIHTRERTNGIVVIDFGISH